MKKRSSVTGVLLVVLIAIVAVALIGGGCAISGYNKAVRYEETVGEKWAQVENVLQRRYDLIPNLVETVKGYAGHEKEVFTSIAEARTKYFNAGNTSEKAAAATGFERALSRLIGLKEDYPQLKADQSFLGLQAQLEGTENRISVERGRYNEAVKQLNTYRRSFFGRTFCTWAGVEGAEYFEPPKEVHEVPKVDFGSGE
jgi:LemA protein